jgi:hypothetical protein
MLRVPGLAVAVAAALLTMGVVSAQDPTVTPTATVTATPTTPTPTTGISTATPTTQPSPTVPKSTPTPEPEFNFDEVKEVVVPLIGDDGRTHYVTLTEDTAGIVRVRLSLFSFQYLHSYSAVVFDRGDCGPTGTRDLGPADLLAQFHIPGDLNVGSGLSLWFFNTDRFSLTGPKSIYDSDGAVLAIYRPGSGGSGLRAACAVLAPPLGPPSVGTGTAGDGRLPVALVVGVAGMVGGVAGAWALRRRTG